MPDHYYTAQPQSEHRPATVETEYRGCRLTFETDSGVFSRLELDRGTEELLNVLPPDMAGRVLDLGCGYGVIGLSIGKRWPACEVTMTDVNERAVGLARKNAERNGVRAEALVSDGYAALGGRTFDAIVQNPPIRAGKAVIYQMFADGAAALRPGGALYLVIRKQQGAPSAAAYLHTLFARVDTLAKKGGYWMLRCEEPKERKE